MTIADLTLGVNMNKTSYGPISYGKMAGKLATEYRLSVADINQKGVQSLEKQMESWGWKKPLKSGFSRLRFSNDPLNEKHREGMIELSRLLGARFVDLEIGRNEINTIPSRKIRNKVDWYSIFVPTDGDFDDRTFEHFVDDSRSHGNCEFLFRTSKTTDEERIRSIVQEYGIYDSDVWLYVPTRKVETTAEKLQNAIDMATRNNWNVSPRMGLLVNADEEFESDE